MTAPRPIPDGRGGIQPLRHALPADTERKPHAYAIDGVDPAIAFVPGDRAEVALALRRAAEAGLTVVPQGSRTALALGHPLEAFDVALDLRGLHRVVAYVPDDLTITVEAGTTLRTLQAELGEHGQYLPVDPPPDDHVTVGGLLATARSGAWRGHLPAPRDLVLGVEVALPSGELVKSGGRVVKNVTGYDLHRLHTGALGAFGLIVEATFKVAPRPPLTRTLAAPVAGAEGLADAATLARACWDANLAARAITILPGDTAAHLGLRSVPAVLVDLAGTEAAVERSTRDLLDLGAFAEAPAEGWTYLRRLHGDQDSTVLRIGVPATSVGGAIEAAREAGALAWGHVASGAVIAHFADPDALDAIDAATVTRLRTFAEARGGYLQVESAPAGLRAALNPGGPGDPALVTALRDRFDPQRIINRGRWGAGL
jgi:glycolate oxidase FAD binding subunit